jgi:hypothetical protein
MERVDALVDDGGDPIQRIDTAVADLAGVDREHWTSHMLSATETRNRAGRVTPPPRLNPVVDLAALTGDTPEIPTARGHLDGIGPITRTVSEHVACCGTATRLVTAGPSVVLDMGRRVRVVTTARQRALTIRDRHCQVPS